MTMLSGRTGVVFDVPTTMVQEILDKLNNHLEFFDDFKFKQPTELPELEEQASMRNPRSFDKNSNYKPRRYNSDNRQRGDYVRSRDYDGDNRREYGENNNRDNYSKSREYKPYKRNRDNDGFERSYSSKPFKGKRNYDDFQHSD